MSDLTAWRARGYARRGGTWTWALAALLGCACATSAIGQETRTLKPSLSLEPESPGSDSVDAGIAAIVEEGTEEPGTRSLSFGQALGVVWKTNPQVEQAELALKATDFEISGSRAGYYPYVIVANEQDRDGNAGIIRFVQPIWNGGLTGAQVDVAKATQMAALADLNRVRLQLGLRTVDAYFNQVAAQELNAHWEAYIAELKRLTKVIERRSSEGVAPQADVQTATTRLSQARAGYEANRSLLEASRATLATLLNLTPPEAAWPAEKHQLTPVEVKSAGSVGIDAHPERQFALAQVRRQQATSRAAKASLWPQLSAEYRRALEDFSTDSGNDDTALLTMQYQTDSGLRGYQQYKAEAQRAEAAKASYEAAAREVEAAIRTARAERAASLIQIEAQEEAVASSRALVDSFFRQFEVGRKSWLEVLNALRETHDTILQSVSAKRNFWVANGRLGLQGLYWQRLSDDAPTIDVIQLQPE